MLKHSLFYRLALMAVLAISTFACGEDEEPAVPQPNIASVSPAEALPGTQVTISGTNLANATAVRFGDTDATITTNSASSIATTVPANIAAGSQEITVTTPGGTATHAFTVTEDNSGEEPEEMTIALTADDAFIVSGYGETVLLTANVEGPVSSVVFFDGDNELGTVSEAPFTWSFEVGDDVAAYTNYNIVARAADADGNEEESDAVVIRVGERFPLGDGELTGVIEFNPEDEFVERWNTDGPTEGSLPDDGRYPGYLNWNGDGDLEAASGVNLPVSVPEAGNYLVSLGLASGHEPEESYMNFYFNELDENMENVQRSAEVPSDGWLDFADYPLEEPYELTEGEHTAKVRFGGPFVHPYYVDLFKY